MAEQLLTLQQVADLLQVPPKTIYQWNHSGTGPPRYRVGKYVRYRLRDVEKWLGQRFEDN